MKKLTLAAAAAAALVCSGVAVAHGIDGGTPSFASVSGTFTATTVSGKTSAQTCTNAAGKSITTTRATYTGTASGSADLTGAAILNTNSTIDTTDGVGLVQGTLRVGKTQAQFTAVYDHGNVAGLATGHGASHTQLVANLSAGFSATGGFTGGKLGGSAGGSAVEVTPADCRRQQPQPPPKPEATEATGSISAVSSSSITVAGLTCSVPTSLASKVTALTVGTRVEIRCAFVSGTETLVTIDKRP
jgi:hypothetical protein